MSRTADRPPNGLPDATPGTPWVGAHTVRPPAARPADLIDLRDHPGDHPADAETTTEPGPAGAPPTPRAGRSRRPADTRSGRPAAGNARAVPSGRLDVFAVVGLAVLAAASARHLLGTGALTAADADHALVAKASSLHELGAAAFTDLGHGALLAVVLRVTGGSILAAQLVAFVAALAAPATAYLAARRLALHRAGALLAGAVVAGSALQLSHVGTLGSGTIVTFVAALMIFQGAGVLAADDRDDLRRGMLVLGATTVAGSLTALLVVPAAATVWAVVLAGSALRFGVRTLVRPVLVIVDLAAAYALFVIPADAGASLRDGTATGGHLVDDRGLGELLRSLGRAIDRTISGLAPSLLTGRGVSTAVLGAAVVIGAAMLVRRRRRGAALAVLPPVVAVALALGHLVPLGGPAGTWLLPALALCAAAAVDPLVRRLPPARHVAAAVALAGAAVTLADTPRPATAAPSLDPVARVLATVPAPDCVVLNGIEPASFHWATTFDVRLVGRVPGGSWVKAGYPSRCVSFPGTGAEWFDRTVRTTADPGSPVVWWVQPAGATDTSPPATFTVAGRQRAGSYEVLRLLRR